VAKEKPVKTVKPDDGRPPIDEKPEEV